MPSGEHILIVENDPDIADRIGRQSLRPLGYQTSVAEDAASALQLAFRTSPDLILADLDLPGLSGKDLIAALNSQGIASPLIVIARSGREADAVQAFRLGAMDALFLPIRDAEVVSAVERALRQTEEARERQKLDRQLRAANEELRRRLRDLTTVLSIAKAVVSITDQRLLFDRVLESAQTLAEADLCWLTLREERSNVFLLRAQRNLPEAWAKKMNQPVDDGIGSLVALSGESLLLHGEPLQKIKLSALGKSAAIIPIKIKNEVIGLLNVARKNEREFSREAQTLLEAMADFVSISLVNARLFRALEQAAENARASEKQRQAEMANELQTALNSLNFLLKEMAGTLNSEQKKALESAQAALQRLSSFSEKTASPGR